MTHAAARHRELDRAAARAMGDAPGHGLVRSRDRLKDQRTMERPQARVLLATLTECTSAGGRVYLRGWLGASNLVAFQGEDDEEARRTWQLFLTERRAKPDAGR